MMEERNSTIATKYYRPTEIVLESAAVSAAETLSPLKDRENSRESPCHWSHGAQSEGKFERVESLKVEAAAEHRKKARTTNQATLHKSSELVTDVLTATLGSSCSKASKLCASKASKELSCWPT